ncbi:23S rRNA (uridine(2552)-2'-O)-methyltransferase RlmE [Thiotrichales bacterium 19S9-12]|nr:23S rRNA (uridine(2552)-2'-O)-methyltransferase RlmE [Thiotrichales bacterium 19S9-11]MCF6811791.1 23S rRNA (uridine(2552)-2'-O)-methyltransferase RlmE [Thiotrichales bacterium 19S9-12]
MSKSKSSKRWLDEHFSDQYVQQSKKDGARSRAYYKLIELNDKYKLFKPGMTIVDLGAAPGGWSQAALSLIEPNGKIFALDILPMDPIAGVNFIQGDFTEDEPYQKLLNATNNSTIDWVISDMAPNMSGNKTTDQARSCYLVELAIDFANETLKPHGSFLAKAFQGSGFTELVDILKKQYQSVAIKKPEASRARSSEVYLIARDKNQ